MKSRLSLLLILLLVAFAPAAAWSADVLQEFTETGGCRLRGSRDSVTRLKEIAAQGAVTWEGKCQGGYIDGPGTLRHQGVVRENERSRRYAFYLTGTAKAGVRTGIWKRETFNMFEDSSKYWTSLATITYADGVANGSPKLQQVRSNADFTPSFRQLLAETDDKLAAAPEKPGQPPDTAPAAGIAPLKVAPLPAAAAEPQRERPIAAPGPGVQAAATAPPAARPQEAASASSGSGIADPSTTPAAQPAMPEPRREPLIAIPGTGVAVAATARPAASQPDAAPAPPRSDISAPARSLSAPAATPSRGAATQPGSSIAFQGSGLRLGASAPQKQQILEQRTACVVDEINEKVVGAETIVASASQPLRIAGWAADPQQPRIPEQAWVRFYDRSGGPGLLLEMPRNTDRPDVAQALGHPAYARAGFRLVLEPGQLAPGEYTVALVQQFGADLAICSSIGRLSLK
jgi:hypothetical protein